MDEEAKVASEKLAEQRGVFAEWERSIWGPDATCARGPRGERVRPMRRLRNCNLTTVAPTGTISINAATLLTTVGFTSGRAISIGTSGATFSNSSVNATTLAAIVSEWDESVKTHLGERRGVSPPWLAATAG